MFTKSLFLVVLGCAAFSVTTTNAFAWGASHSRSYSGAGGGSMSHTGSTSGGYGGFSHSGSTTYTGA
ncbi:MAG: hypothetical protein ACXWDN_13150, partial [Limisphaerales bacterium]